MKHCIYPDITQSPRKNDINARVDHLLRTE